ncbi:hypothetical protein AVEN_5302-1 [Araneus ventricosus]|uniref:Gustatory receptor n=1 Tax=Araneus ventricosus TaxID=182803 RepID=A0A4Y2CZ06_ARAVE|nr:hypothetical protein AVEN_5302-1 [Araneus ventricosus]
MGRPELTMPAITVHPIYHKFPLTSSARSEVKSISKDENTSFLNAIKPLLLSLMIVGVQTTAYFKSSALRQKVLPLRWWVILTLIYLHLFSLKTVVALLLTSGGLGFWMQLTTFLRSSVATISADIYVIKRNKLHSLILKLNSMFNRFGPEEKRCFKNRVLRGTFVIWIFMAMNFVISTMNIYRMGMANFLDIHFFSLRISFISPVAQYVLGCILLLIRQAIMWGTLSFMIMYYVFLCEGVRCSFKSFNLCMMGTFQNESILDERSIKKLQKYYVYVTDLVSELDDIFSPAVFFWSSAFILSVCIDITFDISLYSRMNMMRFFESMQKLIILFLAYVAIGISASLAIEEGRRCLQVFYKVTASFDASKNYALSQAVQFFAARLATTHFALTGWKFFDMTRGYMLTVFGILGSYIILVFQLNPETMTAFITA